MPPDTFIIYRKQFKNSAKIILGLGSITVWQHREKLITKYDAAIGLSA